MISSCRTYRLVEIDLELEMIRNYLVSTLISSSGIGIVKKADYISDFSVLFGVGNTELEYCSYIYSKLIQIPVVFIEEFSLFLVVEQFPLFIFANFKCLIYFSLLETQALERLSERSIHCFVP